jgi:hypothetical protein
VDRDTKEVLVETEEWKRWKRLCHKTNHMSMDDDGGGGGGDNREFKHGHRP